MHNRLKDDKCSLKSEFTQVSDSDEFSEEGMLSAG